MNITRLTQQYISERPSVKDCLTRGLINYSALAREICREHKIRKLPAVVVACRRYRGRIKQSSSRDRAIRSLISHAKLRVHSKMAVATISKPRDYSQLLEIQANVRTRRGDLTFIEGDEAVTLVTNADFLTLIRERLKGQILDEQAGLALLTMIFSRKIETTPGVVSFIYGRLAEAGINLIDEMSCWTDVIMVIEEEDLPRALQALSLPPSSEDRRER